MTTRDGQAAAALPADTLALLLPAIDRLAAGMAKAAEAGELFLRDEGRNLERLDARQPSLGRR